MGNIDRHRAAHEAFNARLFDDLRAMCADDMVFEDQPRGLALKSGDEFIDWTKTWCAAMSNAAVTDATYYDAGDTTIARFTGRGTHDGPLGPVPATGRRLAFELCEIMHWNKGKIVSGEMLYDQVTLLVQVGAMEPPPPA